MLQYVLLALLLELGKTLIKLIFLLLDPLQLSSLIIHSLPGEMYLDVLDLIITSLKVVLGANLLLQVPQLARGLGDFLRLILKIAVHHPPVKVIKYL